MKSHTATYQSRVKVTGFSPDVTAADLSKLYALIDGFKIEQQAIMFASGWNEAFKFGQISIKCEIDTTADRSMVYESSKIISFNDRRSHSNRSTLNDESDDDDVSKDRDRK
jgi:hypothetical protein